MCCRNFLPQSSNLKIVAVHSSETVITTRLPSVRSQKTTIYATFWYFTTTTFFFFVLWMCQPGAGELPHVSCLRLQLLSVYPGWNPRKFLVKVWGDWISMKRFKSHHKMKTKNILSLCDINFISLFTCTFKVYWNCSWQNKRLKCNIAVLSMWASGYQPQFFQLHN